MILIIMVSMMLMWMELTLKPKIDVRIDYKHFVCTITIIRDDLFNFVHYVQTIVQLTIKHTKDRSSYLGLGIGVHINCYPSTHLIFYVGYFLAKLADSISFEHQVFNHRSLNICVLS